MIKPIKRKQEKSYWARREANKLPRKYRCEETEKKIDQLKRLDAFITKIEPRDIKWDDTTLVRNLYSGEQQPACTTCKKFVKLFANYINHVYIIPNNDCTCMAVKPKDFQGEREHILAGILRAYSEFPPNGYKFIKTTNEIQPEDKHPEDFIILKFPEDFTNETLSTFNYLNRYRYVYNPIYTAAAYGDLKSLTLTLLSLTILIEYGYEPPQQIWETLQRAEIASDYSELAKYLETAK